MINQTKNRIKSFHFAVSGLNHAFYTQPNFQIQIVIALFMIMLGYLFEFSRSEWIILVLTIGLVLGTELFNTVVEVVVDLAVKEKLLPDAKIAKDVAAASVLLMSFVSIVVGLLLFWPHIKNIIIG